jgi:hypothetical protein
LTDEASPPADLFVTAQAQQESVLITLEIRPTDGDKGFPNEPSYRRLAWGDVEALAGEEAVVLQRGGPLQISVAIPWAR